MSAALARQLQQAGLDPDLLKRTTSEVDIVMGDVPEGALARVKTGQGCEARFFGVPEEVFTGKIDSIAPDKSDDRVAQDPNQLVRVRIGRVRRSAPDLGAVAQGGRTSGAGAARFPSIGQLDQANAPPAR